MIDLTRNLSKELLNWCKSAQPMPILLRGARQVGKTHLVTSFAKKNFIHFVHINFELQPNIKSCFNNLEPNKIISAIGLATGQKIIPGKTLLFLDEIQDCPQAIVALRYFKENLPNLHVISAGSLLEFTLNTEGFSMPVGRVQFMFIKPLSFVEFLLAMGNELLYDYLNEISLQTKVPLAAHEKLLQYINEYMALGGMPAIIAEYVQTKDLLKCENLLGNLLLSYQNDFSKYAKQTDHKYLQKLFNKAPHLVAQWFRYSKVDPDVHSRYLKHALELLSQAGLITKIQATAGSGIPLISTINEKKFKLLFLDTGLVRIAQQINLNLIYNPNLELLTKGALTEQFVGQELLAYAQKVQQNHLYFWQREQRGAQAEVDYLYVYNGEIFPLEVKSGGVGRLKSLKIFMQERSSRLGLRVWAKPLELTGNILSIPFYLINQLPRLIEETLAIV